MLKWVEQHELAKVRIDPVDPGMLQIVDHRLQRQVEALDVEQGVQFDGRDQARGRFPGVNNFMAYVAADLPVGSYDRTSLANTGIGHYALDGGVGYTYLDPQSGHELSAVAGFTNNYTNP